MIRLVCIDVDGTLIGSSGVVPEGVWQAADALRSQGVRLALASGRPAFGVARDYAQRLDPDGWHVFQNGASIVHLASGASSSTPVPVASVQRLVARARQLDRPLELYGDFGYAVESRGDKARRHAGLLGVPFTPRAFEELGAAVVRAQWLLEHEELAIVRAEPHTGLEFSPSGAPGMPDTTFVSLTAAGVTKASALQVLAERYALSVAQIMFVGDGLNDVEALRVAGVSVAMGNAEPEAKAVARHHVGHVDHGGLVQALALVGSL